MSSPKDGVFDYHDKLGKLPLFVSAQNWLRTRRNCGSGPRSGRVFLHVENTDTNILSSITNSSIFSLVFRNASFILALGLFATRWWHTTWPFPFPNSCLKWFSPDSFKCSVTALPRPTCVTNARHKLSRPDAKFHSERNSGHPGMVTSDLSSCYCNCPPDDTWTRTLRRAASDVRWEVLEAWFMSASGT